MEAKNILAVLLILSIFIETTVFSFPFVFVLSLLLFIFFPEMRILFLIFFISLLMDVLKSSATGIYPLVIFSSFALIALYRKAFELKDYKVVLLILFLLTFAYAKFASYADNLIIYVVIFGGSAIFFAYFLKKKLTW